MEHESVSGELEIDLYEDLTAFSSKSPEQQEAEVERIVVRPSGPLIKDPEPDFFGSGPTEVLIPVRQSGELSPNNAFGTSEDPFDQSLLAGRDELFSEPAVSSDAGLFEEPLFRTERDPESLPSAANNGDDLYPEPLFDTGDLIDQRGNSPAARTTAGLNDENIWDDPVQPVNDNNRTPEVRTSIDQQRPTASAAGPSEVICASCGELTAADDLLCIACGAFIGDIGSEVPFEAVPEPEPQPEPEDVYAGPQILTCSDCGSEVTPDELFCPSCGTVL